MSEPKHYECALYPDEDGWYWVCDTFEKMFNKEPKLFYLEHFDDHFQMSSITEDAQNITINLSKSNIWLEWYGPVQPPEIMKPSSGNNNS